MRLVIDIPEDLKYAFEHETDWTHEEECVRVLCARMRNVLENGKPLLKGHGRLKDIDWIDNNCSDYRTDDDGSFCYKWEDLDNAPTIIEADKED